MDVESILSDLGIEIASVSSRKDGSEQFWAHCPFHFEGTRTDSVPDNWSINSETGRHKCWSCGFSGTLEWLIHKKTGVSLSDAANTTNLAERITNKILAMDPWGGERRVEIVPMNEARIKMYDTEIPEWALSKRRLTVDVARAYDVRWSEEFVHGPSDNRRTYPHCWITPIRHPVDLTAMGMQVKQEDGDRFFRNLPTDVPKRTTMFGVEHLNGGTAGVVESPLDAPYLSRLEMPDTTFVSSMGAHISDEQMELMIERCDRILFFLDDDDAGWKAVRQVLGINPETGRPDRRLQDYSLRIPIFLANYGEAAGEKDPGEMILPVARACIRKQYSATMLKMALA